MLEGYHTGKEQHIGRFKIDVVWKRTKVSDPAFAFEVELSKQIAKSLIALITANKRWTCYGVLVAEENNDLMKARSILEEDYEELTDVIKIVDAAAIDELHALLLKTKILKEKTGYRTKPV